MTPMEAVNISTPAGALSAIIHIPDKVPAPVIVCCHGLLSSKDSSKYVSAGEEFSEGGFATVRFDFSGCGSSEALPADSLIDSRMKDLDSVLYYVSRQAWAAPGRTALFGSSMGGYLALLAAASGKHEIGALACWATPFDLREVENGLRTSKALGRLVQRKFVLGAPRDLSSLPTIRQVLIIHGQQDEIVPWKDALSIHEQVGALGRLLIMETADHRFSDRECRRLAMRMSLQWFQDYILGDGLST